MMPYSVKEWQLAEFMHREYERIAKKTGWETQQVTRTSFDTLPEANKRTMLELARRVIQWFERDSTEDMKSYYFATGFKTAILMAKKALPHHTEELQDLFSNTTSDAAELRHLLRRDDCD